MVIDCTDPQKRAGDVFEFNQMSQTAKHSSSRGGVVKESDRLSDLSSHLSDLGVGVGWGGVSCLISEGGLEGVKLITCIIRHRKTATIFSLVAYFIP